jgi:DNA-binding response OmpR family regulator
MSFAKHIIVVDDEADIVDLITYNLSREGFLVDSTYDGETALKKIHKKQYDLLVLDLLLPKINGIEVCRKIKSDPFNGSLPIIILSAKGEEIDKILGLEMGADDYMTKPFSPRELIARIHAVLRRAGKHPPTNEITTVGELVIDKRKCILKKRGKQVKTSATEFKLLCFLAERKGKVFTREELLDALWRNESFVGQRTIDVHIRRLREQIENNVSKPQYIKTRQGFGYYFDGE